MIFENQPKNELTYFFIMSNPPVPHKIANRSSCLAPPSARNSQGTTLVSAKS
jgi:hypothetical protein